MTLFLSIFHIRGANLWFINDSKSRQDENDLGSFFLRRENNIFPSEDKSRHCPMRKLRLVEKKLKTKLKLFTINFLKKVFLLKRTNYSNF